LLNGALQVSNIRIFMIGDLTTGESVVMAGDGISYSTPDQSDIGGSPVPTSDPNTANIQIAGSYSGALTADGWSNYFKLQLQTTLSTPNGALSEKDFFVIYDEV